MLPPAAAVKVAMFVNLTPCVPPLTHSIMSHPSQHVYPGPTHPEGQQHPQPSGRSGGYPYARGHILFPEPSLISSPLPRASAGHSVNYLAPPPLRTMSQITADPYQQERQRPHDYHSSGGSSGSHHTYPTVSSVASSSMYAHSEFQPHPGGSGYTDINARAQPQNLNATVNDEGPQGFYSWHTPPSNSPVSGRRPQCRYPSCYNYTFVDMRVNELREWCSDNHMRAAVQNGLEKPCKQCRVWPRRNGYRYCSGNICRYRPPG